MTKSELRKARKTARAAGQTLVGNLSVLNCSPSSDRDSGPVEFSPERHPNGRYNMRRARALDRVARLVYDFDRDF